jgi:crossover junction endodeoxyribonuclease RuvC
MTSKITVVCGIDPGLQRTGYGVLRVDEDDDSITVMDTGVVRCSPNEPLGLRLAELAAGIDEVLDENDVEVVAVEQIYSHYQRPRTAILMAHARGVMLLEAARRDCRIMHLPATTIKRHLTGNGRASKEQIQRAVADILSLSQIPEPADVADALAIALCAVGVMQQRARRTWSNDGQMMG